MRTEPKSQAIIGLILLVIIILIGTVGYVVLEPGMSFFDAFYMTIITVSTTGFKEVHDLSFGGRVLTIILIIMGLTTITYSVGRAVQAFLIESEFFWRKRMNKRMESTTDHHIVCGYGRMGIQISEGLYENNIPFVVVENDEKKLEKLRDRRFLFVEGDATNDDVLIEARIKHAKGLVAVVRTDAENVFTTLTAKELNPDIFVVARAIEEGTESKLIKAGADRVVKPYEIGGNRMLQLLLRPGVMDFIDGVARNSEIAISLEEIFVKPESLLVGHKLVDSPIRKEMNIIIVAISKANNTFIYNPKGDTVIDGNDKLIAIGGSKDLAVLADYCLCKK